MHVKKCNQHSTYFIRKELEALFELAPKQTTSCKTAVIYRKRRHPVVPIEKLQGPADHRLAHFLSDW
jgi:hypothetical protein